MRKFLITLLVTFLATTSYAQIYTVERVIDGNIIAVTTPEGKSEKVRLIGISTPKTIANNETKMDSERTDKDVEVINKIGLEAFNSLKYIVKEGHVVRLEFDVQERDEYGRLLAYLFLDEDLPAGWHLLAKYPRGFHYVKFKKEDHLFLNATMVGLGYAVPMPIEPNSKYSDLFQELHEAAKEEGRGYWEHSEKPCDLKAMVCPDGTTVGPSGPNCEYKCPQ